MKYDVLHGDVIEKLQEIPDNTFDALLSDPPYSLNFMGLDWDKAIPGVEVWGEVLRTMKPGAFGLVFGGTRTFHRLAVALEDAGFEMRDTLMWVYGSGFPKSHDVSKAIDKASRGVPHGGADPTSPNHGRYRTQATEGKRGEGDAGRGYGAGPGRFMLKQGERDQRTLVDPDAQRWEGYGTALKPAYEPVLLVRKPTKLTYAKNVLEHGTGALNIDGTRIPLGDAEPRPTGSGGRSVGIVGDTRTGAAAGMYGPSANGGNTTPESGRWPANVIHDGSDEVLELFPTTKSGKAAPGGHVRNQPAEEGIYGGGKGLWQEAGGAGKLYGDEGSAARFFHSTRSGEASADSENDGAVGFKMRPGQRRFDEGSAARFFYTAKASARERNAGLDGRNTHPTVKPIALTEYLAKLLLPPTDDAHLLVPYSGSGSELIGALRAGWPQATGIEIGEEWVATSMKRLAHFASGGEA